jgi:hypothetical protein
MAINESDIKKISDDTKIYIVKNIIEPSYRNDINEMINGKKCWRIAGIGFETVSKILVACGGVLSFSSAYFNNTTLSFVSGSVSIISLALLQLSSFSYTQHKKQGDNLNVLLKSLDLNTVPVLQRNADDISQKVLLANQSLDLELDRFRQSLKNSPVHTPRVNNDGIELESNQSI